MINVFCTRKLESFLSVQKKDADYVEPKINWLCHLILVGGKKCLLFIDKKSLYSVLILNVQKKDLPKIEFLFVEEFIIQLVSDGILNPEKEMLIRNKYANLTFYETDNDQKTLGTLRDNHSHINRYISDKVDKLYSAKKIMHNSINSIPLGGRKYAYAVDLMKAELENLV